MTVGVVGAAGTSGAAGVAAIGVVVLLGCLAVFQVALVGGVPWGRFAHGGQHPGSLPASLRAASVVTVLLYVVMALVVLDRAGAVDVLPAAVSRTGAWVVVAVLALSTLANLASRSRPERLTMTPVALVLTGLAVVVAVSPGA